jgi:hypothetical protein
MKPDIFECEGFGNCGLQMDTLRVMKSLLISGYVSRHGMTIQSL